jgi:excinuclease ABC subunit B
MSLVKLAEGDYVTVPVKESRALRMTAKEIAGLIRDLTKEMKGAAKKLEFERATALRDEIKELSRIETELGVWG